MKILIVEDEKPYARALSLKFEHSGLKALLAGNGEEALEIIQKEKIDLMILDLVMPKMNGFDLLEKMQELSIKIPVMVLSNLAQEEDRRRALELGVSIFFEKANTPISEIINKVLAMLSINN